MHKPLALGFAALFAASCASPTPEWVRHDELNGEVDREVHLEMATDQSGVFVGSTYTWDDFVQGQVLTRHGTNGGLIWKHFHEHPEQQPRYSLDAMTLVGGKPVTVSAPVTLEDHAVLVVLWEPQPGIPAWSRRFDFAALGHGFVGSEVVAADPSGAILVGGEISQLANDAGRGWFLLKYSDSGELLWSKIEPAGGADRFDVKALAVAPGGDSYLGIDAEQPGSDGLADVLLQRVSAAGELVWSQRFAGEDGGMDQVNDLVISSEGAVYLAGTTSAAQPNTNDALLLRYTAEGELVWSQRWNRELAGTTGYLDILVDLTMAPDGDLVMTGLSRNGNDSEALTMRYGPDGTLRWASLFGTPGGDYLDRGKALAVDAQGHSYVVGVFEGDSGPDLLLIHYDQLGQVRWWTAYDGPNGGRDIGQAIVLNGDGDLFAAGFSLDGEQQASMVTLRYHPSYD